MWCRLLPVLALGGCAQILGLDATSGPPADARIPPTDSRPDAQPCLGGDASAVDPTTGACFVFFAAPVTRDDARVICQGLGPTARLATIQSASENALITRLIGTNHVFVGGSDELTEGTFVWDDGTPVLLTNWMPGEPNNGGGMHEEDCMEVVGAMNGMWNDVPCAPPPIGLGAYPFVCERD